MLFDLRGRGRRRTVQAIYLGLAILMGVGLIGFGVGSGISGGGGLLDAVTGSSGAGSNVFDKRVKAADRHVAQVPTDAAGWATVADLRLQLANATLSSGQTSYGTSARADLFKAKEAWSHYLALNPPKPDPMLANRIFQAFGDPPGIADYPTAAQAAEIVAASRPTSGSVFAFWAVYAFKAGQTHKGELAEAKALALTPKASRATLKQQIDQIKAQAVLAQAKSSGAVPGGGASPTTTAAPSTGAPAGAGKTKKR